MSRDVADIPLIDVGRGGASALCEAHPEAAAALIGDALGTAPVLRLVARVADPLSRSWLERHGNPYLHEIQSVARRLDVVGVYFLNVVYEWACSTSAGPDPGGAGTRLIRILDWGLKGTGRYGVIARHDAGPFFNATWPGYAGVITAMAPGGFPRRSTRRRGQPSWACGCSTRWRSAGACCGGARPCRPRTCCAGCLRRRGITMRRSRC